MTEACYTLFLALAGVQDLRRQAVSVRLLAVFAGLGLLCRLLFPAGTPFSSGAARSAAAWMAAFLPGLFCLMVSKAAKGAMGYGDGLFFLTTGLYLGAERTAVLLTGGLLCCSIWCLAVLAVSPKRTGSLRTRRVPLLPFLFPVWGILLADGARQGALLWRLPWS